MNSSRRTLMFLVVISASLTLSACSGEENAGPAVSDLPTAESSSPSLTTLETTGASRDQYEETTVSETTGLDSESVTLRFEGSEGVRFDGRCEFGGEVRRVAGRVPARLTLDAGGSALSCDIGKLVGQGRLRVVLTSDGSTRSVQQVGTGRGMLRVSYDPSGPNGS